MAGQQVVSPEELVRIEAELHKNLAAAKAHYQEAKAQADQLSKVAQDLGLQRRDGNLALRQATRTERQALDRYRIALEQFSDFVLRWRVPRGLVGPPRRPSGD